jgi:hypothetical protein
MLRTEATARRTRRLERSLKRSHLGTVEGLDGFDSVQRVIMWSEEGCGVRPGRRALDAPAASS